jgi:hypothetical protein
MARLDRLAPLLGATVAGPLGVVMLPRMWYKSALSAAGMLYEGYTDYYRGFNQRVVDGLGLEPAPWFEYLKTLPTYPEAEDYVRKHAKKLDAASIAAVNEVVLTFERPEENAAPVRARTGLDDPNFRNSALLLNWDDWLTMHEELLAHRNGGFEPIVPMISSSQTGLLEIPHLPRLWIKALLSALGALPEGWKTGVNCGFDTMLAELIGLDLPATTAYIAKELPNYLVFERWVAKNIKAPGAATKAQWTAKVAAMEKAEETAASELIEAGATGLKTRSVILLNDLVDWKHMHDALVSLRSVSSRPFV